MPKTSILIVDDEAMVLMTYRVILERAGYEVVTAESVRAAEEASAGNHFDLLLCDLSIEKQHDGIGIIEAMHRNEPRAVTVLITGFLSDEVAERVKHMGTVTVSKPINVPNLLQTIDTALRSRGPSHAAD
jgi:DNA-binding NtrC family response regulator